MTVKGNAQTITQVVIGPCRNVSARVWIVVPFAMCVSAVLAMIRPSTVVTGLMTGPAAAVMLAAIHPTIRTVVQPAISVAGAMHVAMTSRMVLVVVPVASLCVLGARLFVSLSFVFTGQRGVAAAKNCGAENERY